MPDIDHFSDSEGSFHSFDDEEPSPPASTHLPPHGQTDIHSPTPHSETAASNSRRTNRRSSAHDPDPDHDPNNTSSIAATNRFAPAEEATLLAESNSLKGSGNTFFGSGSYENAIQTYDKALSSCPNYLDYEVAVLRSNIAACHLKLDEWKEAVDSATKAIEVLERVEPLPVVKKQKKKKTSGSKSPDEDGDVNEADDDDDNDDDANDDGAVQELSPALAARIDLLQQSGHTLSQIRALQTKLLLRRAKANAQLSTWQSLQAANEDYNTLLHPTMVATLSASDHRTVVDAAQKLAPRLKEAQEREVAEMMGKLRGLGDSILKPFGLSTGNFNFVKDERTGGYSMNFSQNPGK
ncbi:hypothetical protein BAUCODRAFT_38996 [Baudoinia panamericana UAMH 10762]|uniref:Uncharacterized protein n=1 Tax=Baudoinia panamericana (strain UAMH 10762) TaxID=717646 RepID=M2MKJ5_BAUPA|nr:uncharacterized protein BAUCODRAFT_38996 [Baudoinia panamericana UAMH 10762]EMC91853.1 hypothetical protein BAUCODRAFT_38996 [Baudoinia panamericana UAMH 10762]